MQSSGGCGKTVAILATLPKNPRKTHFFKKEDRQLPGLKNLDRLRHFGVIHAATGPRNEIEIR
jgi:hypothetical protein